MRNFRKFIAVLTISAVFTPSIVAQTLVTVAGENISTEDFMSLYNKNNYSENDKIESISVEEYFNLFVNFKLKVKEAENLGYDQDAQFIKELEGYRTQLAKPYLMDEETSRKLINEAYENMHYDIRASHILITLSEFAKDKDTIAAWNKIMDIRQKFLNKEAAFADLAYKYSDDPSARERVNGMGVTIPANNGDLGYFSSFDMVYPFEHVAFKTQIGDISMPVRSKFGYHLIYVTDKLPALGECQVAHLIIRVPTHTHADSVKTMKKLQLLYDRLIAGEDFNTIVKNNSDDESSRDGGGVFSPFTPNQLDPTFIKNISPLQPGEYSKPFFTIYGGHIVKMIRRTNIKSLEEELPTIKRKISQSDRANIESVALYNRLKKEHDFSEIRENLENLTPFIVENYQRLDSVSLAIDSPMFSYDNETVYQSDFISYFKDTPFSKRMKCTEQLVVSTYEKFVNETLLSAENNSLEQKHQDFRLLMGEYHDGILLFNINNDMVWKKAVMDTVGLKTYYDAHKDNYVWDKRVKATIFTIDDSDSVSTVRKELLNGTKDVEILRRFNARSSHPIVTKEERSYEKGDNPVIDKAKWKTGISKNIKSNGKNHIVVIHEVLEPRNKSFDECRGLVTSDYQTVLDSKWISELKAKYDVVVNEQEYNKIK
ncbi:MAG: peptidylprolyl isomerase [Bacteroidales bacterium]|nr:peptidylprolyl isomerase [Bacteroidales bacterium]